MTRPGEVVARFARQAVCLESEAVMLDRIAGNPHANAYARALAREGAVAAREAARRMLAVEAVVQEASAA